MAVNTAYVASSELLERVAHRYNFHWVIRTNARQSLYRIHILNAVFFSIIILMTNGSQMTLAEMYALGLVACFTINMGSLLIYRYGTGTKEIREYYTSRLGTLLLCLVFLSCFVYLAMTKPFGIGLWTVAVAFFIAVGFRVAKHRAPEIVQVAQTDTPLQMVFALADVPGDTLDIYLKRPLEGGNILDPHVAYVSFYSPRQGIPQRLAPNHWRFANTHRSLFDSVTELLYVLKYELPHKRINVHIGWPMSSWMDRFSIGVMVFSIMKFPKMFPDFNFVIEYLGKKDGP
jgi:hypothetical protein